MIHSLTRYDAYPAVCFYGLCGYHSKDKTEFHDSSGLVISVNKSNKDVTCEKCLEKIKR